MLNLEIKQVSCGIEQPLFLELCLTSNELRLSDGRNYYFSDYDRVSIKDGAQKRAFTASLIYAINEPESNWRIFSIDDSCIIRTAIL
jgi:hypothetical protein